MKSAKSPISFSRESRFWVALFVVLCLALFIGFVLRHPVRFRAPQPLGLRYYALEAGLQGGPLSSDWADYDWRKALIWRAGDTECRNRQFAQFFETLMPRLNTHIWYHTGPFLWSSFDLFLTILIGILIVLLVREWGGSVSGGMVAAGFWLLTVEVLVEFGCPVRPTKSLLTVEVLLCIWLLLRMRGRSFRQALLPALSFVLVYFFSFFTDEYAIIAVVLYLVVLFGRRDLRRVRYWLAGIIPILALFSLLIFTYFLPSYVSLEIKQPFYLLKIRELGSEFFPRNLNYLLQNTIHLLKCVFGWLGAFSWLARMLVLLVYAMSVFVFFLVRGWRGLMWPLGLAVLFIVLAGALLLPAGTDILYQSSYYNRPLISLLMIVIGVVTGRVLAASNRWLWILWLGSLLILGTANARFSVREVGLNNQTLFGVDDILELELRLRSKEMQTPVYLAYPRSKEPAAAVLEELEKPKWFTREESPSWTLYRYLTPLLYLRKYEKGILLGNPREFKVWADSEEDKYLDRANTYYDMIRGEVYRIDMVRNLLNKISEERSPDWLNVESERKARAHYSKGFWGFTRKAVLPPGRWRVEPRRGLNDKRPAVLIAVVRGEDNLRIRATPSLSPDWRRCTYDWCYELLVFNVGVVEPETPVYMEVEAPGGAEVLGPVLLPAEVLAEQPLGGRSPYDYPLSGIRPLRIYGKGPDHSR